jgi:hypothetical protein
VKARRFYGDLVSACGQWYERMKHDAGRWDNLLANAFARLRESEDMPRVVTLCGSTRFYEAWQEANFRETMAGRIVLTVGFYPHGDVRKTEHGENVGITPEEKAALDVLHKRKIDMSDEILVLNVGRYFGASTKGEIVHALRLGLPVRWLEEPTPDTIAGLEVPGVHVMPDGSTRVYSTASAVVV